MVIDAIIYVFIEALGGSSVYYSLFALYFLVGTAAVFYKVSTT